MAINIAGMQQNPNIVGNFQQGMAFGQQQREQERKRADEQRLRELTPQILAGDPNAYTQGATIDYEAAGKIQGAGDVQMRRLEPAIAYVKQAQKTGNPQAMQAAWDQVRPYFARVSGHEPPADFATAAPHFDQLDMRIQMAKAATMGAGQRPDVKVVGNALVDASGNVIYQAPEQPRYFQTDQGLVMVGPGGAKEVTLGGPPISYDGAPVPAGEADELAAAVAADARGEEVYIPVGSNPQVQGRRLLPASTIADRQRLQFASDANRRAEEAAARAAEAAALARRGNAPTGFRFKDDGTLEPIPGGPKPAGAAATEGERKAATLLQRLEGSLGQLQAAVQDDPEAASPSVGAEIGRSLPFVGTATANFINSPERQRVEAAQLDILDAALTLGTGAAYTREQLEGYRRSFFPQIGDSQSTIDDKADRLQNVIRAAKTAAGRAAPQGQQGSSSSGWSIQRIP